jgi:hypothetical protein
MTGAIDKKAIVTVIDEYDLSTEKTACPEINNAWWPHSMPTDAPTK